MPSLTEEWARAEKYIDRLVSTTSGVEGMVLSAWPAGDRKIGLLIRDKNGVQHYTSNEYATIVRER